MSALASELAGCPRGFVSADVLLDGEPVVGSFTVDGMTFAVTEGSDVELVGVSSDWQQLAEPQEDDGSLVAPMQASGPDGPDADSSAFALPESIAYEGVDYAVTSIGAYAFYLSGATSVELPASVGSVDVRAFRSSDVASVSVADGNATYSSFDGALYDADQLSLLLIPEGKQGAVLLPDTAEEAKASVFSHCSLVDAIFVEGGAALASENGLLYDASLTTLLRVPAGATDVTIHDGCTTIAAGALEACANLEAITAPASVTSISPDVFTSVPTVSLPVASAVVDDPGASTGATEEPSEPASSTPASSSATTQLTAMVALSSADDDLPEVDPSAIEVSLPDDGGESIWQSLGISCRIDGNSHSGFLEGEALGVDMQIAARSSALYTCMVNPAGRTLTETYGIHRKSDGAMVTLQTRDVSGWEWVSTQNVYYYNVAYDYLTFCLGNLGDESAYNYYYQYSSGTPGYSLKGFSTTYPTETIVPPQSSVWGACSLNAIWRPNTYTVALRSNGGSDMVPSSLEATYDQAVALPMPSRSGYRFNGWNTAADGSGTSYQAGVTRNLTDKDKATITLYAQWEPIDYDLGFDVDSEPGDEGYPGIEKPDETVNVESGPTVIEDPKRPGYVFQGWVIPDADGEHAIDQDLVYKDESDGKWYVDASKLPDYANDEGRVELTARWTSVISVDVPSAATFYYDLVTDQSGEAHEAALSGTTSFSSQSQVGLRVCGLESVKAEGADSLFASGADGAVMSVYPAAGGNAVTVEGAQGAAGTKPASAVDFALDDVVLEGAFAKAGTDAFAIPAGDDLTLTYRLNLGTGATLDYDRILAMAEGDEASLASLTYTFAADYDAFCFWTIDDGDRKLGVFDIKADAEAIAAGDATTIAKYTAWMDADHRFYVKWYDQGLGELEGAAAQGSYTTYAVRIIGLNHDDKADGSGKAGITFQFVDCLNAKHRAAAAIGEGWVTSELHANMNPSSVTEGVVVSGTDTDAIWNQVPLGLQVSTEAVKKPSFKVSGAAYYDIQFSDDKLFLPSIREVFPRRGSSAAAGQPVYDNYYDSMYIKEGTTYAFYAMLNPYYISSGIATSYNPSLYKTSSGSGCSYWYRTTDPNPSDRSRFELLTYGNTALWAAKCTSAQGVSPAFCL